MEVCYDETTKSWTTRPLTVRTPVLTLRERVLRILRKILARVKSFLKLD
jgi:hypothetical protein